jgi:hypothetical protein
MGTVHPPAARLEGSNQSAACKFTVGELAAGVLGGVILFAAFLAICNRLKGDA